MLLVLQLLQLMMRGMHSKAPIDKRLTAVVRMRVREGVRVGRTGRRAWGWKEGWRGAVPALVIMSRRRRWTADGGRGDGKRLLRWWWEPMLLLAVWTRRALLLLLRGMRMLVVRVLVRVDNMLMLVDVLYDNPSPAK